MPDIPVIDLGAAMSGTDMRRIASDINEACHEVGFFQVVGHGVPTSVYDDVYASIEALSASPIEYRTSLESPHPFRGFYQKNDKATGRVVTHNFQFNRFDDSAAALAAGVPAEYVDYFRPNIWPDEIEGFEAAWRRCLDEKRRVGTVLMSLFATALEIPVDFFAERFAHDATNMNCNKYFPRGEFVGDGDQDVVGWAHTDSGTLTVLHQRGDFEALEVEVLQGEWVRVPFDDDRLTINIGDLMSRWTNDEWRSTPHRVVGATDGVMERTSVVGFYSPSVDTVIEPIAGLSGRPPMYAPVRAYDWEKEFLTRGGRYRSELAAASAGAL